MRLRFVAAWVVVATLSCAGEADEEASNGGSTAGKGGAAGSSAAGSTTAGAATAGAATAGASTAGSSAAGSSTAGAPTAGGAGSGGGPCSPGTATDDVDGDGWTEAQGDCNDCNAQVNPGAIDLVELGPSGAPLPDGQQVDDDCDGSPTLPTTTTTCDAGIPDGGVTDPMVAVHAIDLCKSTDESPSDPKKKTWGVVKAAWNDVAGAAFATPKQSKGSLDAGVFSEFGSFNKAKKGASLFALSSGTARPSTHAEYPGSPPPGPGWAPGKQCGIDKKYESPYPPGFPKASSCGGNGMPHDGIALDVRVRVPTNAKTMRFDFRFFTCEYPVYVCSSVNDTFAVLMSPSPLPPGDPMNDATNMVGDIAFETSGGMKGVISVNNQSFMTACNPGPTGYDACKGIVELTGTGFELHGGSAWLESAVPVPPGEIIDLRFGIWDAADGILDSTALVDDVRWSTEASGLGTGIKP